MLHCVPRLHLIIWMLIWTGKPSLDGVGFMFLKEHLVWLGGLSFFVVLNVFSWLLQVWFAMPVQSTVSSHNVLNQTFTHCFKATVYFPLPSFQWHSVRSLPPCDGQSVFHSSLQMNPSQSQLSCSPWTQTQLCQRCPSVALLSSQTACYTDITIWTIGHRHSMNHKYIQVGPLSQAIRAAKI